MARPKEQAPSWGRGGPTAAEVVGISVGGLFGLLENIILVGVHGHHPVLLDRLPYRQMGVCLIFFSLGGGKGRCTLV